MAGWKDLEGKSVKVIFDDARNGSIKLGKIKLATEQYIYLTANNSEEIIATSRIIRLEILEGRKNGREE